MAQKGPVVVPRYRRRAFHVEELRSGRTVKQSAKRAGCSVPTLSLYRSRLGLAVRKPSRARVYTLNDGRRITRYDFARLRSEFPTLEDLVRVTGLSRSVVWLWNKFNWYPEKARKCRNRTVILPRVFGITCLSRAWLISRVWQGFSDEAIAREVTALARRQGNHWWTCRDKDVSSARTEFNMSESGFYLVGMKTRKRALFGQWLKRRWTRISRILTPVQRRILREFYMARRLRHHQGIGQKNGCSREYVRQQRKKALRKLHRLFPIPRRFHGVTWRLRPQRASSR